MSEFPVVHENGVVELDPKDPNATVCGHCGRGWDDTVSSSMTPTPSARCPFEYEHKYEENELWANRKLTLYFVGETMKEAYEGLPFDSYESAESYQRDNPGSGIYSANTVVYADSLVRED